jgi:hypothetical protein
MYSSVNKWWLHDAVPHNQYLPAEDLLAETLCTPVGWAEHGVGHGGDDLQATHM